jgi:hypothetical protein
MAAKTKTLDATTEHRYTVTITPMSEADLQLVIDDIRKRFGRKHLIHVIGMQPSGTGLMDAPGWDKPVDDAR